MLPPDAALVLIDLQLAIDDPRWAAQGPRNNPNAEHTVARLLAAWRSGGRPIFHIRHESTSPGSTYAKDGPGSAFKAEVMPLPGEPVIALAHHAWLAACVFSAACAAARRAIGTRKGEQDT